MNKNETQNVYSGIEQENERLRLENMQLKKRLEKEEFFHKTLYRQWTELNLHRLAEKREVWQFESKNSFYKYAFYFILCSFVPVYFFLSSGKGGDSTPTALQNGSPSTLTANQDTVQLINVKLEQKIIQPEIIQNGDFVNHFWDASSNHGFHFTSKNEYIEIVIIKKGFYPHPVTSNKHRVFFFIMNGK
jgi:hypothetical protein